MWGTYDHLLPPKQSLDRAPKRRGVGCELEAIEVGADFGVGPVGVADDFAADDAFAIDDVGLGPAVSAVKFSDFLIGIADGVEIDVEAGEEAAIGAGVFIDADGEDGNVRAIVVKLHEGGGLLDAGRALTPPEVQENDFAPVVGEADGVLAIADGEVGGDAVGVYGRCSAVACCCEGEHQQKSQRDETRKPHVSIIRSGRDRKEGWVK